jgi:hypothetical protein
MKLIITLERAAAQPDGQQSEDDEVSPGPNAGLH